MSRIEWKFNPLATIVHLDDADRDRLQERGEHIWMMNRWTTWDKLPADQHTYDAVETGGRRWLESYEKALLEEHCGDCTCVPSPCMKCHAEAALGVRTCKGLGKYGGNALAAAFRDGRTLDKALKYLDDQIAKYSSKDTSQFQTGAWAGKDPTPYFERWKEDAEHARAWLLAYAEEHKAEFKK